MGKKKVLSEGELNQLVVPSTNDVLGVAIRLLGFDRVHVKCQNGNERLCRIRAKMERRVWIREGDVVLVSPWNSSRTNGAILFGVTLSLRQIHFARKAILPFRMFSGLGCL